MFPSDDPRKKELLLLHNSNMLEYDKKLHKLADDKEGLSNEWNRAVMENELYRILLPERLKRIHDLMQALGIRERKLRVEECLPHGVVRIREKVKKVKKKKKPKKSKNDAAIDLAVKIIMDKGEMSEEQARKMMAR